MTACHTMTESLPPGMERPRTTGVADVLVHATLSLPALEPQKRSEGHPRGQSIISGMTLRVLTSTCPWSMGPWDLRSHRSVDIVLDDAPS